MQDELFERFEDDETGKLLVVRYRIASVTDQGASVSFRMIEADSRDATPLELKEHRDLFG